MIKQLQIHAMNALTTEAKIMAMCMGLKFALSMENTSHIMLIIDSIYGALS